MRVATDNQRTLRNQMHFFILLKLCGTKCAMSEKIGTGCKPGTVLSSTGHEYQNDFTGAGGQNKPGSSVPMRSLLPLLSIALLVHSSAAFRQQEPSHILGLPLPASPFNRLAGRAQSNVMLCAAATAKAPPGPTVQQKIKEAMPRIVDIALQGFGLAGTIALMGLIEPFISVKLFAPPMMASGIIFFLGESPPQPTGFLSGTLCGATISLAALTALTRLGASAPIAAGGAAGAMLMWYKANNIVFPPNAVLPILMSQAIVAEAASTPGWMTAVDFLVFPWLVGHAALYAGAQATAAVRRKARMSFLQGEMKTKLSAKKLPASELRAAFRKYDMSKNGALDAAELKMALRMAVGVDVSVADATSMIRSVDTDGDEQVNYNEFEQLCQRKTGKQ